MRLSRRAALSAAAASVLPLPAIHAQSAEPIRIGVLTDLAGPYRDVTGPTSVACVRQAVEEFTAANPALRARSSRPTTRTSRMSGSIPSAAGSTSAVSMW